MCFFQENIGEPIEVTHVNPEEIRALIREGTLILKEPLDVMAGPLRTYRKRLQVGPTASLASHCTFSALMIIFDLNDQIKSF